MRKNNLLNPSIILILFLPAFVSAETVTLKSGKAVEGKIVERTDKYIKIESEGSPIYYELKYIKSIDESSPGDANTYLKAGLKYGSEAKFKESEEAVKKGLSISPSSHNLKEALRLLDDLKSGTVQQDYAVSLFRGTDALMNAKYKEAIPEFQKALKLKPNDADIYYYLGVCNYSLEQYREAADFLEKSVAAKPDEESYYLLGVSYCYLGQYPEAITYLSKVLETNPNDAQAYSLIGTSNYVLGNSELGRKNLNKAKELFKSQGDYVTAGDIEDFLSKAN